MSRVVKIQIRNFRKFKHFDAVFGSRNVVCFIGRGDSGKSTILDAISYCLAPSWNLPVSDYDFHSCDVSEPIEITSIVTDFPDELKVIDKYGLYCSGWDESNQRVVDATEENCIRALQIVLTIDASLEPKWEVVNSTSNERKPISAKDRAKLNAYMVSDYINNHFAWANGSPLSYLSRVAGESLDTESLLEVARKIRKSSWGINFGDFGELLDTIAGKAIDLGVNPGKLTPAFDMKRLAVKEGAVCLHDSHDIPLRLMGKGSRRLMSIAIQSAVSDGAGITLIDEIEQGLEPDRICQLVHSLRRNTMGQTFFTTHSSVTLAEMGTDDVFWINDVSKPRVLPTDAQGFVRSNPGAFFGKKVILCEGKTECGFCRTLDRFFVSQRQQPFSSLGVVIANGEGSTFEKYARVLLHLDMPFLLFCDSDEKTANLRKDALAKEGVCVVEWQNNDAFEDALYKELPNSGVVELNQLARDLKCEAGDTLEAAQRSMWTVIRNHDRSVTLSSEMLFVDNIPFSEHFRRVLGHAAKDKAKEGGSWFKSITGGIKVGEIVCKLYAKLPQDGYVRQNVDAIRKWIHNV